MEDTLKQLYQTVISRKEQPVEGSYTCYLFEKGLDKILKKVGEECAETIIAAKNGEKAELVGEINAARLLSPPKMKTTTKQCWKFPTCCTTLW